MEMMKVWIIRVMKRIEKIKEKKLPSLKKTTTDNLTLIHDNEVDKVKEAMNRQMTLVKILWMIRVMMM